jgi:hypothetical protein
MTEESLIAIDASVAASDAALIQDSDMGHGPPVSRAFSVRGTFA